MTTTRTLAITAMALGLALPIAAEAFEGTYTAGSGRHVSMTIIKRISEGAYRVTVEVGEPGCAGRVEARAVLSNGILMTTRGRVPGPGAEVADICKMTIERTPSGIRIGEEECSFFHGARCGFDGAYRGSGAPRTASASAGQNADRGAPARLSDFYCKTPDTIEAEHADDPTYRVRLPSTNVRPELAYEIFRHKNRFAFPAPSGDPSEVQTISGVTASVSGDTMTVTARSGQRWTVRPVGSAVVQVSGHGLSRPITGRGCVWR